jgi:hypothetical protein
MRFRSIAVLCVVCALLLVPMPMHKTYGQDPVEYKVHINTNGSAAWTITQVSDVNGTVDTWDGFQQKVLSLVDAAMNQTHRQMSINNQLLVHLAKFQRNPKQSNNVWRRVPYKRFLQPTLRQWRTQNNISVNVYGEIGFSRTRRKRRFHSDIGVAGNSVFHKWKTRPHSDTPRPNPEH